MMAKLWPGPVGIQFDVPAGTTGGGGKKLSVPKASSMTAARSRCVARIT